MNVDMKKAKLINIIDKIARKGPWGSVEALIRSVLGVSSYNSLLDFTEDQLNKCASIGNKRLISMGRTQVSYDSPSDFKKRALMDILRDLVDVGPWNDLYELISAWTNNPPELISDLTEDQIADCIGYGNKVLISLGKSPVFGTAYNLDLNNSESTPIHIPEDTTIELDIVFDDTSGNRESYRESPKYISIWDSEIDDDDEAEPAINNEPPKKRFRLSPNEIERLEKSLTRLTSFREEAEEVKVNDQYDAYIESSIIEDF